MRMSESISELAKALAQAQKQIEHAPKNRTNQFKGKFADLASIIDAIKIPLADNGLSYSQVTGFDRSISTTFLYTRLFHVSGQWIESEFPLPFETSKFDKQQLVHSAGSWLTYMRRYCLNAILGLADEDDDNQVATQGQYVKEYINPDKLQKFVQSNPAPQTEEFKKAGSYIMPLGQYSGIAIAHIEPEAFRAECIRIKDGAGDGPHPLPIDEILKMGRIYLRGLNKQVKRAKVK